MQPGAQVEAHAVSTSLVGLQFDYPVIWYSTNAAVATVTPSSNLSRATVTAVSPGNADIVTYTQGCIAFEYHTTAYELYGFLNVFIPGIYGYAAGYIERQIEIVIPFQHVHDVYGSAPVSVHDPLCDAVSCPDDGNPCTVNCVGGVCAYAPGNDGAACAPDEGLLSICTADICQGGACAHPLDPVCALSLCLLFGICG